MFYFLLTVHNFFVMDRLMISCLLPLAHWTTSFSSSPGGYIKTQKRKSIIFLSDKIVRFSKKNSPKKRRFYSFSQEISRFLCLNIATRGVCYDTENRKILGKTNNISVIFAKNGQFCQVEKILRKNGCFLVFIYFPGVTAWGEKRHVCLVGP